MVQTVRREYGDWKLLVGSGYSMSALPCRFKSRKAAMKAAGGCVTR